MKKTQHDFLRETYSDIIKKYLHDEKKLESLSGEGKKECFDSLSRWFGVSPPEGNRVKKDLKTLIKKIVEK